MLDALPGRAELHERVSALLRVGGAGAPAVAGASLFSLDRWGDHEQAVLAVRRRSEPGPIAPRVLVDPDVLIGDPTAAIDWYHPSSDGTLVAYGISTGGDERSTLRVIETATGRHLDDEIPDTRAASVGWWPDNTGFAYTRYPEGDEYHRHVRAHRLGDVHTADEVLYDDLPEPTAWPDVAVSRDGRWMVVHVSLGWSRTDVHLVDRASGARSTIIEGVEALTALEVVGDRLIGSTTVGADRGRVVVIPVQTVTPEHWVTAVPESEAVIEGVAVTSRSLLVASTFRAVSRLDRYDHDGGGHQPIPLPELGSLTGLDADPLGDDEQAVFSFTSYTRPSTLFRWTAGGVDQWSQLPGGPEPGRFHVEQVRYPSTDGTPVSMFLVRDRATTPTPATPTVLNGYGGFAVTMSPAWSPFAVAHAEDGGLFAVACIRGGAEDGEAWHRAGMRERKQQVFDDFYAAADWLVAQGLTSRARLAIRGGSNGGLLMGAAVTQRPDLGRAVLCAVPLLDMLRYHRFRIARLWIPEYGDPDEADDFAWLHAYSPYHHVGDGTCYPAVLVTSAEGDSRVDPNHARKFAARLQAATSCGQEHPILVHIETEAGHGQGKPAARQADELADAIGFIRWQLGT